MSTADCVPILLRDLEGEVVGAVHAGWRGVVGGIIENTVEVMREVWGVCGVVAAVGPCMGQGAFEVGGEVAERFNEVGLGEFVVEGAKSGKFQVDLVRSVVKQLKDAGAQGVDFAGDDELCSYAYSELFYSHRRENGATGRMMNVIGLI